MTSREHVERALVRLLREPGIWPPSSRALFRNRLLDEAGGDHRALVDFIVLLSEIGAAAMLVDAAAAREPWPALRNRVALAVAADRFLQLETVRWGIQAWGRALGIHGADMPEPTAYETTHVVQPPSSAARPPVQRTAGGAAARRSAGHSPVHVAIAPSAPAVVPRRPTSWVATTSASGWERYAVSSITMMLIVAVMFMWFTRSSTRVEARAAPEAPPSSGSPAVPSLTPPSPAGAMHAGGELSHDSVFLSSSDTLTGRIERLGVGTLRLRGPRSEEMRVVALSEVDAVTLQGGTRLDRRALLRAALPMGDGPTPPEDRESSLAGAYVVQARRSSVGGGAQCDSIGRTIEWNQRTLETVEIDSSGGRFRFRTRPGVRGAVGPSGAFRSEPLEHERDGTSYAFRLEGQQTPTGFIATGETWTATTLYWRKTIRCRFVATLVGTRLN